MYATSIRGTFARIAVEPGQPGRVIKVLIPETLDRMSRRDAESLALHQAELIRNYRNLLIDIGVPVTGSHNVRVSVDEKRIFLIEVMEMGATLEISQKLVSKIISMILPLMRGGVGVAVDLDPGNFVEVNGRIVYCDFFPARFRQEDGMWLLGFPQPPAGEYEWTLKRYTTPIGMMRRLRFQLARETGNDWTKVLLAMLPTDLRKEVKDFFLNLPEWKIKISHPGSMGRRIIRQLEDPDDVRDVAARLRGHFPRGMLREVMKLTRVDFRLSSPERREKIEDAKRLLVEGLK